MVSPLDSASFLQMLVRLTNAKTVVEVGVFTGFTALAFALALPADGVVHAFDISSEFPAVGKPFWAEAGVEDKIKLQVAPATQSMQQLLDAGAAGTVDIVFLDADKTGYDAYYELALQLLRKGGIVVVDNTLMGGSVASNPDAPAGADTSRESSPSTVAIKALNEKIFKDERVEVCMLPLSDGVSVVYKL